MISHELEHSMTFKECIERNIKDGSVVIAKEYLVNHSHISFKYVIGEPFVSNLNSKPYDDGDIALPQSTKKILNKIYHSSLRYLKECKIPFHLI